MGEDVPSLKRVAEPRSLKPAPGVVAGYRKIRPRWMWASFAITLILIFVGVALIASPPMESKTVYHLSDTLEPQYYHRIWFVIDKGEKIQVKGYVDGGNDDIKIYVQEGGRTIKNFGVVKSPIDVMFVAPEDGNYSLFIDNSISIVTSKRLNLDIIRHYYDYAPGFMFLFAGIGALLIDIIVLAKGQKQLVVKVDGETYEFWGAWGGLKVKVNEMALDTKIKPGDKFRIGPNDEHLLEVRYVKGRFGTLKFGVFVDGREVGRLP